MLPPDYPSRLITIPTGLGKTAAPPFSLPLNASSNPEP
jgi:hypothetical protein